jgi:type 1 glutamine amidotransferase
MKTLKLLFTLLCTFWLVLPADAQSLEAFELTPEWIGKIRALAPDDPTVKPRKERKALMFSLHTGYEHWVIPHADAVMKVLSEKAGRIDMVQSKDITMFEADRLKEFDVVILNNNCSKGERRDLFWDKLGENTDLSEEARKLKAAQLEDNLIRFVQKGGGLMLIHGAIVMQNNSMEFSAMVGGSFDYHPPQQKIELSLVEPDHPLLKAFDGQPFVHVDEPYFFNNAYADYNFRPLLSMDVTALHSLKQEVPDKIKYVSWIKPYGKGRVFYISPSHNAQSYENSRMLRYLQDGLLYTTGDLKCDDAPMQSAKNTAK